MAALQLVVGGGAATRPSRPEKIGLNGYELLHQVLVDLLRSRSILRHMREIGREVGSPTAQGKLGIVDFRSRRRHSSIAICLVTDGAFEHSNLDDGALRCLERLSEKLLVAALVDDRYRRLTTGQIHKPYFGQGLCDAVHVARREAERTRRNVLEGGLKCIEQLLRKVEQDCEFPPLRTLNKLALRVGLLIGYPNGSDNGRDGAASLNPSCCRWPQNVVLHHRKNRNNKYGRYNHRAAEHDDIAPEVAKRRLDEFRHDEDLSASRGGGE